MNRWKKEMVLRLKCTREQAGKLYILNKKWTRQLTGTDDLQRKAKLKAELDACTVNGVYARVTCGMDCDCVKFKRIRHVPNNGIMAYIRDEEHAYKWADGPIGIYIENPVECPEEYQSRDLALEAFEDGHPHSVYC